MVSTSEVEEPLPDIEDIDTLLRTLRQARIDREKREAVDKYLEHGKDLSALQHEMHEIMSLLVFQASRRQLLGHLMHKYDETLAQLAGEQTGSEQELMQRKEALAAAIKHADEEVRELAFWSDIKRMAEGGELDAAAGGGGGGDGAWYDGGAYQGLSRSGPSGPGKGKLSGPGGADE